MSVCPRPVPAAFDLLLVVAGEVTEALGEALTGLPNGGPPILLLTAEAHAGAGWSSRLAAWSSRPVQRAVPGMRFQAGGLYVGGPELRLDGQGQGLGVAISPAPPSACRLDEALISAASVLGARGLTVLIGHTGSDGLAGAQALGAAGGMVLMVPPDAALLSRALAGLTGRDELSEKADRQMFLLKLSDALRAQADPVALEGEACRLLGEHLGADGVSYMDVEAVQGVATVRRDWRRGGTPSLVGTHRLADLDWWGDILRRGGPYAVADKRTSNLVPPAEREAAVAWQGVACLGVPLLRAGQLVGALCVTAARPRAWTEAEIQLLAEVGARLREAVGQARAGEVLRRSEESYRALFESIDEGFALCEFLPAEHGRYTDFRYLSVNPAFAAITGLPAGTTVGRRLSELLPPPYDDWVQTYAQVIETGKPRRFERYLAPLDKWMSVYCFPQGDLRFAALFTDVTARKCAEVTLAESEGRLRALIAHLPGSAVFVVDHDLRYLLAQGEALSEAGYRPEDLVGRTVREAITPELVAEYEAHYRQALAGEGFEHEHAAHGRAFITRGVPLRNEAGRVTAVLVVSYDITVRRQAEEAVRALNATLEARVEERTRRLAALNTELLARTRALEAFSHLTRDLSLTTDRAALVERAQLVVMSLLPVGFSAYYEPDGPVWRKVTQVGDPGHPGLQELLDAGLPLETPSLAHPFRTGQPEYQAAYVPGTDTPADVAEHVQSTAALPVRVGGGVVGVLGVGQFAARTWSAAERAMLETVAQHLSLSLDRAEAVRELAEEREALAAFVHFTELAGSTSDLQVLARHATEVLRQVLPVDSAVYFEQDNEVWKSRSVSGSLAPDLQRQLEAGLPARTPSLAMPAARREPIFMDHWQAEEEGLAAFEAYQAVARYPLFPQDWPVGILGMARLNGPVWQPREKAIFHAVGDAFRFSLERAAQLQQIERQRERLSDLNAELGNLITRTAHNLEGPARRLGRLLAPASPADPQDLDALPAYDPAVLHDEVTRLRSVAQDLRQLSTLERQQVSRDLLPLGELIDALQGAHAAAAQVVWHVALLPIVRGDRALLGQALEVLMTFTLSETRGARYVNVHTREIEGEVQLIVEDDGVGLSAEEAATLFDLAVRTDQVVPLMAGGLMQVRRILARHGGWAWAEAQFSGGCVVLAFPKDTEVTALEALF